MKLLRDLIDEPDLGWLVILISLLAWVGSTMIGGRTDLRARAYRIAAGVFAVYCLYAICAFRPQRAEEFVWVVVRGILASGVALGSASIVMSVVDFLLRAFITELQNWQRSVRDNLANNRADRENAETLRREREQYERLAPERERARQEAAAHAQLLAQAQKRRATARAECEFLYHLYSPEVEIRFPRSKFDDFVAKYLSDRELPEDVEAHAEQLRTLMDSHVKKSDPRSRFKSLRDLTDWYRDQKAQIDLLSEGSLKASLLALLHARHSELSMQLLEELTP